MEKYIPVPRKHGTFWPDLVRTLRRDRGMSQRALSDLARVPRNTLRKIEDGDAVASVHTMERILAVLGHELEVMKAD